MFDAKLRPYFDPPLNAVGRQMAAVGISANMVTIAGLLAGLGGAVAVYWQYYWVALGLIIFSRVLDGLDGAVARATRKTALGGYLDIVADFIFYVSIPLAFGFADPQKLVYALALVAAFTITGVSFLAYAVTAAEQGMSADAHGDKSFYYTTGIAEGGETFALFILMCLLPRHFDILASVFTGLCIVTVIQRTILARAMFRS